MDVLQVRTSAREELVDITAAVRSLVREQGRKDGILVLFCPHTTAAVTVNEAADPSVARDIVVNLRALVPRQGDYRHAEGNSDAHIKASLFGPEQLLLVEQGELKLGTWQGVYFCEFDGPRSRTLWVKWLGA